MAEELPAHVVQLKVNWDVPPDMRVGYPTHFVVQHTDQEFYILFFEATPPIVIGESPDELAAAWEGIDDVTARCIGRVALTPKRVVELMKLLAINFQRYQENVQKDASVGDDASKES